MTALDVRELLAAQIDNNGAPLGAFFAEGSEIGGGRVQESAEGGGVD